MVAAMHTLALLAGAAGALESVPVWDAPEYSTVVKTHPNGVLLKVAAPDAQELPVLHLRGNATERGVAYGTLMAEEINTFFKKVVDDYVVALVQSIAPEGLPTWLQKLLDEVLKGAGKVVAVPLFHDLLKFVRSKQSKYVHAAHDNTTMIFEEMAGIAKGVCDTIGPDRCKKELKSADDFAEEIALLNYLPELIRMSCTMVGATRSATSHGKLLQLRALDFGAVPFSNWGMVVVHHKDEELLTAEGTPGKFAMVTFPGFTGSVSGFNSGGLIMSEKVSYNAMSAGYDKPCYKPLGLDIEGCVPGTYKGEGLPFVIRRFIETSATKADAEEVIANAKRTWHVYLGLGDSETMDFDVVGYASEKFKIWNNSNLWNFTGTDRIPDVTFINKHVQPEGTDLYDILKGLVGNMTGRNFAASVPHTHGSGDVHHYVVDHGEGKFYVAMGTTTEDGTEFVRKACDAPVVAFDLETDVWAMPSTSSVV